MRPGENDLDLAVSQYERDGFAVLRVFTDEQIALVEQYGREWLRRLIRSAAPTSASVDHLPLETYHLWWQREGIVHASLFRAANRYVVPQGALKDALLNDRIWQFLHRVHEGKLEAWADPGLGWLGFRFVRPGMNDGYPTSCKAWGAAARVISCWLPIIGHSQNETIALVSGSHRKEYDRYLPENQKFTAGEYRLANPPADLIYVRPELKRGDIIFFHPRTLHTEDVEKSPITRLNLEYRFNPVD